MAEQIMDTFGNICLMSVYMPKLEKPVAALCTFEKYEGGMRFYPLAILVTEDIFPEIEPPAE